MPRVENETQGLVSSVHAVMKNDRVSRLCRRGAGDGM
jgi:hypothetical protein